jgi:hypothetical protein
MFKRFKEEAAMVGGQVLARSFGNNLLLNTSPAVATIFDHFSSNGDSPLFIYLPAYAIEGSPGRQVLPAGQ